MIGASRSSRLTLLVLALLAASAYFYRPDSADVTTGDSFMLLALVVFGFAFVSSPPDPAVPLFTPEQVSSSVRWIPLGAGVACLALLAERNGYVLRIPAVINYLPVERQFLLLVIGVLLVVVGVGGVRLQDFCRIRDLAADHWQEVLIAAVVTVAAFVIRVWNVQGSIPAFIDEGPFITDVVILWEKPYGTLLTPMHYTSSFPRIFSFLQQVASDVFGSSLGTIRLVSAMFGTLTIPSLYLLARWSFDRETALAAAVFLATFPPHVHMSRIGINNIADPLFGVLALAFLVRAIQTRCRLYDALAGAMLGLLPYFYEGGELLFPPLVAVWLTWMAVAGWKHPAGRGVLWMWATAAVVAMPVYYTLAANQEPLLSRLFARNLGEDFWASLLLGGLPELRAFFRVQIMPPLLHYFHAPDASTFYGGETALVLPYLVPLFFLGIFHTLWRLRGVGLLPVLWVLLTALGNSLIYDSAWTARFVVVLPCVALLLGVGLRYTLPMLRVPHLKRWLVVFSSVIVLGQVTYYFGPHLRYYQAQISGLICHYDAIFRMIDRPEDEVIYFTPKDYLQDDFTQYFFDYLGIKTAYYSVEPADWDHLELPPDRNASFFLGNEDRIHAGLLNAYWYVEGPYFSPYDPVCDDQFAMYLAPLAARREINIP